MPLIDSINGSSRRIFLHQDTVGASFLPIDLYKEMRTLRRTDESLRQWDLFMSASGNIPKSSGKFTERIVTLLLGTRIVPFDIDQELTITGTLISDDGSEGVNLFDKTSLNIATSVNINYIPPQVEVITINSGSGVLPSDISAIASSVWSESVRTLTSGGGGSGGGLTNLQSQQLNELWQVEGLDINSPLTTTKNTRIVSAISQIFTGDGNTISILTRQ